MTGTLYILLVVYLPLWKNMLSSVGMMTFPIDGNSKKIMFQTTNQLYFVGIKPWFSVIVPSCDYQMSPSGSWKILAAMKPSACKGLIHHPYDYRHDTYIYICYIYMYIYICIYICYIYIYIFVLIYIYMFIHTTCTCVCMCVCVFLIYTYPYIVISQQACRVPCRKCIQATGFRKLRTPQRSAQLRLGQSQESLQHMLAGPACAA